MTEARPSGLHKVIVTLTPRSYKALESTSETTGLSRTDTINRALQIAAIVEGALAAGGGVFVREAAGEGVRELLIELSA